MLSDHLIIDVVTKQSTTRPPTPEEQAESDANEYAMPSIDILNSGPGIDGGSPSTDTNVLRIDFGAVN